MRGMKAVLIGIVMPLSLAFAQSAPQTPPISDQQTTAFEFRGDPFSAYVCFDPENWKRLEAASPIRLTPPESFFSHARLIEVNLSGVPAELQSTLKTYILDALRLWHLSCPNCPPEAAAVVSFGEEKWVLDIYVNAFKYAQSLSPIGSSGYTIPQFGDPVGGQLSGYLNTPRLPDYFEGRIKRGSLPRGSYTLFKEEEEAYRRLCQKSEADIEPSIGPIYQILCSKKDPEARYSLQLINGRTACNDAKAIGCSLRGHGLQLNIRDNSFTKFGRPDVVLFGSGKSHDLFRILLHETGHWIGMPDVHSEEPYDIMLAKHHCKMCLNETNVRTVGLVDSTWPMGPKMEEILPDQQSPEDCECKLGNQGGRKC